MANESLLNEDWTRVVTQLGGAAQLEMSARQTRAFVRRRQIPDAVSLLRLMLAYCLGERGLRSTAAWAASVGLADLSSVALFYRLRQCGDWFAVLVEGLLAAAAPKASRGRLIRIENVSINRCSRYLNAYGAIPGVDGVVADSPVVVRDAWACRQAKPLTWN
jgi:hypothetical protein